MKSFNNNTVFFLIVMILLCYQFCLVKQKCYADKECGKGNICENQQCSQGCRILSDCPDGLECKEGICIDVSADSGINDINLTDAPPCPDGMTAIDLFCMDIYEASRPDADSNSAGTVNSYATSRAGVFPWTNVTYEEAEAACQNAEKRLCSPDEWEKTCKGPDQTEYCYGDDYQPQTCNGIDAFGRENFHMLPTGSMPDCTNEYGIFDMNGNVWEFDSTAEGRVRGGAYNCIDSESLHLCGYYQKFGTGARSNVGFRCCKNRL